MDSLKNIYALMPTKWRTNMKTICTSAVTPGKGLPAEQGSPGRWQWVNTPHPVQNWEGHNSANERETIIQSHENKSKTRTQRTNWSSWKDQVNNSHVKGFSERSVESVFCQKFTLASFLSFPCKKYCTYFFRKNVYLLIFMCVWICTYEYHMHAGAWGDQKKHMIP